MMKTLAFAIAVVTGGCSWGAAGVRVASGGDCSPAYIWPVVDTALAAGAAGVVGYDLATAEPSDGHRRYDGVAMASTLVLTTAAITGFQMASECRRSRAGDERRAALR